MTLSFFSPRFVHQPLILHFILHRITCKHATVEIMMTDCRYYGVSTVSQKGKSLGALGQERGNSAWQGGL